MTPRALTICGLALLAATPGRAREDALDAWMTVSAVRSFEWSPDGTAIFYTSDAGESGTTEIFRVGPDGGAPVQLSRNPSGERPEPKQQMRLSADGRTLFFAAARYFQNYTNLFSMPAAGGEARALTFNDAVIETAPAPSPDGRTLAYFARTRRGTKIYLLDLTAETAWPRLLDPSDAEERFPVWSPDGAAIAFSRDGDVWIWRMADASARRLVDAAHAGANRDPAFSPDGTRVAYIASRGGYSQVGIADVASGRVTPLTHSRHDRSDVSFSPDGRSLVYVESDAGGMSRHVVLHPLGGGERRVLTRGRGIRRSPRFSRDGAQLAWIEATPTRSADVWRVAVSGGSPVQVTRSMGRIDPGRLVEPEDVSYPASDGIPIPALLYKPAGFDAAEKYPVILRLHGHPGQWNHSFYGEWQFFLQRGFAILAPNPRGSRGFGQGFHDLHVADYGGTELDDVMRSLDFLEALPWIDGARKATWGGSGGGYMSLVIATRAPTAFQAQVIRAPVSSWKLLAIDRFGASGRAWTPTRTPRRERGEFGGSAAEIPEEYFDRSPLNFVEHVKVPQLLLHGLRDSSVLPRQSQVWVARMRELGKGHLIDYVEYPDEDHGLRRYRKTVRDRLERMQRFLAEHLRLP